MPSSDVLIVPCCQHALLHRECLQVCSVAAAARIIIIIIITIFFKLKLKSVNGCDDVSCVVHCVLERDRIPLWRAILLLLFVLLK